MLIPGPEEQERLVQTAIQRIKAGDTGAEVEALVVRAGDCLSGAAPKCWPLGARSFHWFSDRTTRACRSSDPAEVLAKATTTAANNADGEIPGAETPRARASG